MEIRVRTTALGGHRDDAVVLPALKGADLKKEVAAAGKGFLAAYEALLGREALPTSAGDTTVLLDGARQRIPILALAGADPVDEDATEGLRRAVGGGLRAARAAGAKGVTVLLPAAKGARLGRDAQAAAEGAILGLYRFEGHKSKPSEKAVGAVTLLAPSGGARAAERGAEVGRIVAEATALARDLGNEPGNRATPAYLAETARRIAEEEGLEVTVLEVADMQSLGMGSLLGVAKGSAEPAKLIVLRYEPARSSAGTATVALVGKGLTFDSGGISIKPAAKMEDMKFDMCGGAAVLAAMQAAARLKVPLRVYGLVPATENMPGGASYKPGDILKAMNGTTIEVRNTDAEGRLILADAIAYATSRLKPRPKAIVDLATLTGACVVALGNQHAGLVSTDESLARRVETAAKACGDRVWRLPLVEGHRKQLESPYADVSNLGTPGAGALTAAAFLEKFTDGLPWAHLDIAGVAWTDAAGPTTERGATGFGVRLLAELLQAWR
jgi:leucyl aminopeptidase